MWSELLEEKTPEIIEAGVDAYRTALENRMLRFIVEMNRDGNVQIWYDIAGGNSIHNTTYDGDSIEVMEFCFEGWEYESLDSLIEKALIERGKSELLATMKEMAEENDSNLEIIIVNKYPEYSDIVESCMKDELDNYADEYARDEVMQILENKISDMVYLEEVNNMTKKYPFKVCVTFQDGLDAVIDGSNENDCKEQIEAMILEHGKSTYYALYNDPDYVDGVYIGEHNIKKTKANK